MTTDGFERKLTAILSADVKGYSRLMGDDEEETVRTITAYREVIGSVVQKHRGRVVDSPGDNILAEFVSVVDAVRGAVEIQEELKTRNAELPEKRKMEFRVGVNLGDVIHEQERIYGDGVNVAARVESLAEAGGICVSGTVFDHIENKLPLGYEYLGEQSVKNISKPVRVYKALMDPEAVGKVIGERRAELRRGQRVALAVLTVLLLIVGGLLIWRTAFPPVQVASVEKMAFALPDRPSIAVLPFANLSGAPEQEYFSDGLTEDVITTLSKIPSIFVIARNSTFTYKGKPVKVQQVAEELGVRYVLEGSVQKSGSRVRLTAQLIDALSGHHLWAERYDRELRDIFALQDEITQNVATALEVELTEGEQARYRRGQTKNPKAYELYAQGLEHYRRFTPADNAQALRFFEEAVALDPGFLHARADIGWAELNNWRFRWGKEPTRSRAHAIEMAEAILAVDDSHSTANALLGTIHRYKGDFNKAIQFGRKAVDTEPSGADVVATLATTLMYAGQPEEALTLIERAMRLSPKYPSWYLYTLGAAQRQLGNYDEAVNAHEQWRSRNPHSPNTHLTLVYTYTLAGREDDAKAAAMEALKRKPNFTINGWKKRAGYASHEEVARIVDALRKAGLPME
jgi:adenylate cyclase